MSAGSARRALVLGCARLGSTLVPLDDAQSIALLRRAWDLGVRHFDTAAVYGQGDSERLLGAALGPLRRQAWIASKAGQRLRPLERLLLPLKPWLRARAAARGGVHEALQQRRAQGRPQRFDAPALLRSLEASLRRLGTDHLDLFYLHSPPPQALEDPALWSALERARADGKFGCLGVSCDTIETAEAALRQPTVQALQLEPDASSRCAAVLGEAERRGLAVYVRGASRVGDGSSSRLVETLRAQLRLPAVAGVLMGTTRLDHLEQNVAAFRRAAGVPRPAVVPRSFA